MNIILQFNKYNIHIEYIRVVVCEITNDWIEFNENKIHKKNFKMNEKLKNEINMIFDLCSTDNLVIITGEQLNEPLYFTPIFDPICFLIGLNNEPLLDLLINKSGPGDNLKQTTMAEKLINYEKVSNELMF
ncbi:hypothetical protein HZS_8073 [Henneguya salminicola]|nr:hypothetical protein HZS_8073 [Henneguya salminicola]